MVNNLKINKCYICKKEYNIMSSRRYCSNPNCKRIVNQIKLNNIIISKRYGFDKVQNLENLWFFLKSKQILLNFKNDRELFVARINNLSFEIQNKSQEDMKDEVKQLLKDLENVI